MKKKHSFLQDGKGNLSSKRLAGLTLIGLGIGMSLLLFVLALVGSIGDSSTALSIITTFLTTGGGLIGISVFERNKFTD